MTQLHRWHYERATDSPSGRTPSRWFEPTYEVSDTVRNGRFTKITDFTTQEGDLFFRMPDAEGIEELIPIRRIERIGVGAAERKMT